MRLIAVFGALFGLALGSGTALAQTFDKPVKIMAPYAPGGNIDVTARIIADKLREVLGTTVIVENKAGASGMIGSDIVARAAPDGTTLLVSANSLVAVPAIYGNAPYDWRTAFTPITHIQRVPAVLVVPPNSPIKTLADFIALGKDGKFAVADSGIGTTNHLAIELIGEATGTKYTLVHYKGSGAAMIDVMAGQVPAQVDQLNAAIGNIKAGKLRAIAVSSDKRVPQLPDVPTFKESGVKGLENFTFATFTGQDAARRGREDQRGDGQGPEGSRRRPAFRRPHGRGLSDHAAGDRGHVRRRGQDGRPAHPEAEDQTGVTISMSLLPATITPIVLLLVSNVFMTFAWYGHLKFTDKPLWLVVVASWGIAFVEYCFAVPANRYGHAVYSAAELKTMQEVITLTVFAAFSVLYLGERITSNHLVGFAMICGGAFFIFKGPLPSW
jgi:tripartite-type tricarboxylate transporter receptor subunit TctC/uncharacterized protein (DUF486 family)